MSFIEKAWQNNSTWLWLLWPLSVIFRLLSGLRRWLFNVGLLASERLSIPVIIVGNISVGGNGKTPVVIAIAEYLQAQGYQPGVLSRGYGGTCTDFPHLLTPACSADLVGDEPALMQGRLGIPVVIDPDRVRGGKLLAQTCDVIICDDGLQHYRLQRDIEIVVMDERRLGNGQLLPMGPLREGAWRLSSIDYLIVNNSIARTEQEVEMQLIPGKVCSFASTETTSVPDSFSKAIAAIGNPKRFFQYLLDNGFTIESSQAFPDHHRYQPEDLDTQSTIIMTEKDAVKCKAFASENWFYLPISARFNKDFLARLERSLLALITHKN